MAIDGTVLCHHGSCTIPATYRCRWRSDPVLKGQAIRGRSPFASVLLGSMLTVSALGRWILTALGNPRREMLALAVKECFIPSLRNFASYLLFVIGATHRTLAYADPNTSAIVGNYHSPSVSVSTCKVPFGHRWLVIWKDRKILNERLRFCLIRS